MWVAALAASAVLATGLSTDDVVRAQEVATPPPYPPPGRLMDVGGWRLHLKCTGEARSGQPLVVLEAGVGDFSVEWSLVQPGVARFARVCSYDRAGDGWSELGPHPRTFQQIVYELHTLLQRANERAPYVLVGHSYGSWLVRLYQLTYPSEVAGLVLVEPAGDDPLRKLGDGTIVRSSSLASGQPIPPIQTSGPLRLGDIPPAALQQIRAGLEDASRHANEPPRDKLPVEAQRMRTWALGRVGHVVAGVNPVENEELIRLRTEQLKTPQPFGNLPLAVIARGLPEETGPGADLREQEHRADLAAIANRSSRGRLIVAGRSGHHVQLDEPALVVETIQQTLSAR